MSRHGSASPPSFDVASPPRRQPTRFFSNSSRSSAPPNSGGGVRSSGNNGSGWGERLRREGGRGRQGSTVAWRGGAQRRREPTSSRYRPTEQHQRSGRDGGRGEGGGREEGVGGRDFDPRDSPRRPANSRTTPRPPRRSVTNTVTYHVLGNFDVDLEHFDTGDLSLLEAESFEDELMQELQRSRIDIEPFDFYGSIGLMEPSISVGSSRRGLTEGRYAASSGGRGGGSGRSPRNRPFSGGNSSAGSSNNSNTGSRVPGAQFRSVRPPRQADSSSNANSSSRVRGVPFRTVRPPRQADSSSNSRSTVGRNRGRQQGAESTRESSQPQREQRRQQPRIGGSIVSIPASLRSFLLYGIDDLWPEDFDQEFFLGDQSEFQNSGLIFLPSADNASINNLPPTPRVAEGENCQREKLKDELNSNTAECVICTDLLGATEQVWPCQNCYNIFHLYCIRRWAKTNLDTEIVGAWICPVCRRPKYIPPNRLRYRCLCGRLPKPKPVDGVTPHCCGKTCIRQCSHLCHPGPCRPPQPPEVEGQQAADQPTETSQE